MYRLQTVSYCPPKNQTYPENQRLDDSFPLEQVPFLGDEFLHFRGKSTSRPTCAPRGYVSPPLVENSWLQMDVFWTLIFLFNGI